MRKVEIFPKSEIPQLSKGSLPGGRTHRIANVAKARPEVRAPCLCTAVQDDVLDHRVADVANRVDDWHCGGRDRTKIMREGEDGPAVANRTEGSVLGVGERPVCGELCTDDDILAGLIRGTGGLTNMWNERRSICDHVVVAWLTLRVEWYAEPSEMVSVELHHEGDWERTLDPVVDFGERDGIGELHFMRKGSPGRGGPVGDEGVVAADPFRTNIRIYLHRM